MALQWLGPWVFDYTGELQALMRLSVADKRFYTMAMKLILSMGVSLVKRSQDLEFLRLIDNFHRQHQPVRKHLRQHEFSRKSLPASRLHQPNTTRELWVDAQ